MINLQPEAENLMVIGTDYQMTDDFLSFGMHAPLVGYALIRWAVDSKPNHGLDAKQHHLYLKNPQILYGIESAALVTGYTVGRADL